MRKVLLLIILFNTRVCIGQSVYYKGEDIYLNNKPFAVLKQTHVVPQTYTIETFNGTELIKIYPGKVAIKGQQYYVVTFITDSKQAMLKDTKNFINKLVVEFAKNNIVQNNQVNIKAEMLFIKKHPMPKGYQDVEQLINF